jgi:hypothetical protein
MYVSIVGSDDIFTVSSVISLESDTKIVVSNKKCYTVSYEYDDSKYIMIDEDGKEFDVLLFNSELE